MAQFEGLFPDGPASVLDDETVRTVAAALWRRSPEAAARMDEAAFAARKLALYRSVDALSVSDGLKARWRQAVLSDAALRRPDIFVRCVDIGFATNPTSLRRGFREMGTSDGELLGLFRLLGRYQADAARMVFGAEWDALAEDERRAVSVRGVDVFLDIYPFIVDEQKRIAARLENVCSLAVAEAARLFDELTRPGAPRSPFDMQPEEMAEELAALEFTRRLIRACLDSQTAPEPERD